MPEPGSFWKFSLNFYSKIDVQRACLRLQDEHGLDVNMVLFCSWAWQQSLHIEASQFQALYAFTQQWQQTAVSPLRELRRSLKSQPVAGAIGVTDFRAAVQALELEAEKLQQHSMQGLIDEQTTVHNEVEQDLYWHYLGWYATARGESFNPAATAELNLLKDALTPAA